MFCSRCGTEVQVSSRFCPTCGLDLTTITQGATAAQPAAQAGQPNEAEMVRDALKDEYEIEKELGRGGMAVVFKARDKSLEREVAIKVLPFSLSFDAEFVERFQREARTAGKLEHPNIIPIYRVGKSGRVIYFVMKFIRGKSLSSVVEARGALPVPELKRVLIECARALGFAHKHGIVHRDIKPDNIMFDELGQAIVTDFGIAKAQSGARLTGTGMSIGTPHYMSPEQARAQNLDGRSDIYSLGVVAYQCLTGHVPFDGEDSFSIGYKHIMEELPIPPLEQADQRDLFSVIQKMMAKKTDDRYQTAEELVQALDTLGGSAARVSLTDLATMPTRAIEPMKPPPPAISQAATTPLPRASASMMKAPEAAAASPAGAPRAPAEKAKPGVKPAAPPAERPGVKPAAKPPAKKKSMVPFMAVAAVAVVAVGLGSYVMFFRGTGTQVATLPPVDSSKLQAPPVDTGAARAESAAARATAPAPGARTPAPAGSTSVRTTPVRPATTPPTGPTGTLSLVGVPQGARITVDGRPASLREKLAPGRRRLRVEAAGFQRYELLVDIAPNQTTSHTVAMLPVRVAAQPTPAATPGAAAPQAQPSATTPDARCSTPAFGLLNERYACYDVRPSPRTPPATPQPEECAGAASPATVLVRIAASGEVESASASTNSSCAAFTVRAVAFASDLAFSPATKGGQPVAAWWRQLVRALPR